jgi:hypothetical protein
MGRHRPCHRSPISRTEGDPCPHDLRNACTSLLRLQGRRCGSSWAAVQPAAATLMDRVLGAVVVVRPRRRSGRRVPERAKALAVVSALGGTRTPNLLIRRRSPFVHPSRRSSDLVVLHRRAYVVLPRPRVPSETSTWIRTCLVGRSCGPVARIHFYAGARSLASHPWRSSCPYALTTCGWVNS